MMQSKFSLVDSKYLFHDESIMAVVSNVKKARQLLSKLENIECAEGTDYAIKLLRELLSSNDLATKISSREPSDADRIAIRSSLCGPQTKHGRKHTCTKCNQKFFDLNGKIDKCPGCKTPISSNK
jgi:hypothetical protein